MPNDTDEPDDNISPLMEEINWESKYSSNTPDPELVRQLTEKYMDAYRKDPERASRVVNAMLSTFKWFEEQEEARKTPAQKVGEMEAARILGNWGYYDPPIYEEEIKAYAERFDITEREAEDHLRRLRNDS